MKQCSNSKAKVAIHEKDIFHLEKRDVRKKGDEDKNKRRIEIKETYKKRKKGERGSSAFEENFAKNPLYKK